MSFRSPKSAIGLGLLAVILLLAAWRIVVETNSATLAAGGDAAEAVEWRENSAALSSLAEDRLVDAATKDDIAAATELAQRALAAAPLEERALAQIGMASDLSGDEERADRIMQLASGRSLRNPAVQAWLLNRAVARKDYDAAMDHADALLRGQPVRMANNMVSAIAGFAADPDARAALLKRLAGNPPWREDVLVRVGSQGKDPAAGFALLSALAKTDSPPTAPEVRPLIDRLVKDGQLDFAYLAWMHFLPADERARVDYVFNGDFQYPVSGMPFDWTFGDIRGAAVEVADAPETGSGKALHIVLAPIRLQNALVTKLLMLTPGHYRLTGMAKADGVDSERGISWQLSCAQDKGARLGESEGVKGTIPWTKFSVEFDVPAADCRGQWLRLGVSARAQLDRDISGEVWYDKLAVERAAPPDGTSN